MTHIIFLSATSNEHPMDADTPLLVDDLRAVSACHIRCGASREEFMKVKHWVLVSPDDIEDICVTLNSWAFSEAVPPIILGFDALYLVRRIAGYAARRGCRFIPAVWYCSGMTRVFDVTKFVMANEPIEPRDLLQGLKIPVSPAYEPHKCSKTDLRCLVELSDKLNLVNEQLSSDIIGPVELPSLNTEPAAQSVQPARPAKSKNIKQLV